MWREKKRFRSVSLTRGAWGGIEEIILMRIGIFEIHNHTVLLLYGSVNIGIYNSKKINTFTINELWPFNIFFQNGLLSSSFLKKNILGLKFFF